MPQAKAKNAAGLSVELERELPFFRPGDDITGTVALSTAKDFAMGSVVVSLYGRVKVHYVQSHGEGESHWRGRAPLFEQSSLLYSGHHTHKPGTFSWPFRLSVPSQPDQTLLMGNKHQWQPSDSFLGSLEYSPDSPMPGSFTFRKRGFGYRWRAFTEYVLEVQVKEAEGTHMVMRPSQRRLVMPLRVLNLLDLQREHLVLPAGINFVMPTNPLSEKTSLGTTGPALKQAMSTHLSVHTVRASRLASSEQDQANINGRSSLLGALRERRNLLFSANTLPRFTFEVRVSVPETVQLLDIEKGVSVRVAIKPVTGEEKTTIPDHVYPAVRLDNITVVLRSTTEVRFKGAFRERTSTAEYDIKLLDKATIDHSIAMTTSHDFSNTFDRETSETQREVGENSMSVCSAADSSTTGTVDLSTFPGLNICLGAAKQGSQTESPLAPSFRSYIISRKYELRWVLLLDVAGERVKVESQGGTPLTVLSPTVAHATAYLEQTGQELTLTRSDTATSNGQGEDNSEGETESVTRLSRKLTNLFNSKGSKAGEAAAERAAARRESGSNGEELPRYEHRSSTEAEQGLSFENEIRGEPPIYQDVS